MFQLQRLAAALTVRTQQVRNVVGRNVVRRIVVGRNVVRLCESSATNKIKGIPVVVMVIVMVMVIGGGIPNPPLQRASESFGGDPRGLENGMASLRLFLFRYGP